MIHKLLFGYTTRLPWSYSYNYNVHFVGADPNALHVHTNFIVHMLGVGFLHMYAGIIILMLQLKYSS